MPGRVPPHRIRDGGSPMRHLLAGSDARTLRKAIRHPTKALLRLVLRARLGRTTVSDERARLLAFLTERFGVDAASFADEFARSDFLRWFRRRRTALQQFRGPFRLGTTGEFGCEALYVLVRAARPSVVVDTGVLYGASSAHVLAALSRNGGGELHSIDIGRDSREPPHDYFVPEELRPQWELIIGDSRRELPRLLDRCGTIAMFYHDSLHTFEHMVWEFETAFPHLPPGGVLASDDVLNPPDLVGIFRPNAFAEFCDRRRVPYATFHNLGVALRSDGEPASPAQRAGAVASRP
jgi:predicted O-methyltransferase YrrM